MPDRFASTNTTTSAPVLLTSKRRRCYFAPFDDQKLCACRSRTELLEVIAAIVRESGYLRRNVVNHAKELGVWDKFQILKSNDLSIVRFLSNPVTQQDPLTAVAAKLCITKAAARKRIYRDDDCLECLMGGTYSAREVAEGFCMRRSTLSALIQSGVLRAKQLQRTGKWRISSEAIVEFVLGYPRQIPWSRCLKSLLGCVTYSRVFDISRRLRSCACRRKPCAAGLNAAFFTSTSTRRISVGCSQTSPSTGC